jgi:predicted NAD/FAD-binding protein
MRIAIVGGGISGLAAAYLLNNHYDITLYEKNDYLGGHSRTVDILCDDSVIPVDTGFIVFNYNNYPNLVGLFNHLGVESEPSNMSFGVSINNGWLEYGTRRPSGFVAQRNNLLRPKFWRMLSDIFKFNSGAKQYLESDLSLGQFVDKLGLGGWFRDYYLLAMGASIWSTPPQGMLDFPARTFIQFFDNHKLLTINEQPQWYTVKGRSRAYVTRLTAAFHDKIKLDCGVTQVVRHAEYVDIMDVKGETQRYDQVIFACHSDQALRMIAEPSTQEQDILGAIQYQPNDMVLHSDISFMQKRKKTWSSWVYLSEQKQDNSKSVSLSYWMNNLQPLNTKQPIIVTLNPGREPDPATIFDRYTFEHPVFDQQAIAAQDKLDSIQGKHRCWYVGAWQRYGFHEDGLLSAVNVSQALGATIPWR